MRVVDLIIFSGEMMKRLYENGIKTGDYRYLPLYTDYAQMKVAGDKTTYIVAVLCKKYGLCERKVYKVLKHFRTECCFGAV